MVIRELIAKGMALMEGIEYSNPHLESILLLSYLLKVDKNYIYLNGDEEVDIEVEEDFLRIINRRKEGYPLQYLLKEEEFMGLKFYLEEGVLIPRPETELLVDFIIKKINEDLITKEELIRAKGSRIKVLDLGVGSGAISLSIAKYCPQVFVYGVDISDKAIRIANINKERLGLENVQFFKGDLFKALEDNNIDEKFNIIASNPPYIRREDITSLQPEVRHEPVLALDGGLDGLDFYRRISKDAKDYLLADGILIYEIGYDQGQQVKDILSREGYRDIKILKDYSANDRIVYGIRGR